MNVLVTSRNKDDSINNEWASVVTTFFPLLVYVDFSIRTRAANSTVLGAIWPSFELYRDFMDNLITSKNEENLTKTEGARVVSRKYGHTS